MKEVLWSIFMYPFVLVDDIWSFFYRLIDNIKYSCNKLQFDYDDVTEVTFYYNYIMALDSMIFYEESNDKPVDKYSQIISLEKEKFNELKSLLKENRILEYKKNIFRFRITPLWYLWCADIGECVESLTFKFKDGQTFRIDSYCSSKRFDTVVKYLRDIEEDVNEKNKSNIQLVKAKETKTNGFQWVH